MGKDPDDPRGRARLGKGMCTWRFLLPAAFPRREFSLPVSQSGEASSSPAAVKNKASVKTAFYANWGPASRGGLPSRPPSHRGSLAWLGIAITPSQQAPSRVSGSGLREGGLEVLMIRAVHSNGRGLAGGWEEAQNYHIRAMLANGKGGDLPGIGKKTWILNMTQ